MATTETPSAQMTVKILPNDNGNPPGKLADAELHFIGGPLEGLKLTVRDLILAAYADYETHATVA